MVTATAYSTATDITASGDNRIDSLILGTKWDGALGTGATIDYSFPGVGSQWETYYADYGVNEPGGIAALNAGQKTAFRNILQSFADVANITFNEVTEDNNANGPVGDIRIAYSDVLVGSGAAGWAYQPDIFPMNGDIWIEPSYTGSTEGSFSKHVLAHELGHALGLSHSFDTNGNLTGDVLPGSKDTTQYTIMSYTDNPDYGYHYASGPQLYDILTLQYLYGVNTTYNAGANTYSFSASSMTIKALWDAGGTDTISAWNQKVGATINLTAGSFSSIGENDSGGAAVNNIAIAFGATIENATGSYYADILNGNSVANKLIGKGGKDTLIGRGGNDTLNGGAGKDRYYVDNATDVIVEKLSAGKDSVYSSVNFTLDANVENLILRGASNLNGTGNKLNNVIRGNDGGNVLKGNGGNDRLYGNGGNDRIIDHVGTNKMIGGTGNDRYYISNTKDVIIEGAGAGTDTVLSKASFTLGANVEKLFLMSSANINGTGNTLNNLIKGNKGNNVLNGDGGADVLIGGAGKDVFRYDALSDAGDVIRDFNIAGGEYLKVGTLLSSLGWVGSDAVGEGWLKLVQNGTNVGVMLDVNGGGDAFNTTLATINGEVVGDLGSNWWLA